MISPAALVTLATALLALAGTARMCRAICTNGLDGAAALVLLAAAVLFGVFALGNIAASMPAVLLDALLVANPIVAVASAARIDIFHTALLYDLSPIAHRDFQYPAWHAASALYGVIAAATFVAARAYRRADGLTPSTR